MNKYERMKMVAAMEFICRNLNDERAIEAWLIDGVADGDIDYGDFSCNETLEDYVEDDEVFADLMDTFVGCIRFGKRREGTLYCDGVLSK